MCVTSLKNSSLNKALICKLSSTFNAVLSCKKRKPTCLLRLQTSTLISLKSFKNLFAHFLHTIKQPPLHCC